MQEGLRYTLPELPLVASRLLQEAGDRRVWLFEAPMGAGKTTLIKALAAALGVQGPVSSPTFGLVHEYEAGNGAPIYHFDCYRLRDEEEALGIGVGEYFDSGHYCWVEWPSKIEGLWPAEVFYLEIAILGEDLREIGWQAV
jgi:tRNA threonylcarbamoyladenosine biosynthesis protein TsaE